MGRDIKKILGLGALGLAGLIGTLFPIAQRIKDEVTADKKVVADAGEIGKDMRTIFGFDENGDGQTDRIVEYFPVVGWKWATVGIAYFTPEDERFEYLKRELGE